MAEVKIDFYTVTMPTGAPTFERLVMDDEKTTDDESRNQTIRGYPVRLQQAKHANGIVEGEMLRIQMSDLPPKAKLDGTVASLNLHSDEGIGGETAFLYQPATRVLVLQRHRSGVSASALAEYFGKKGGLAAPIKLDPVIQKDVVKRLMSMKETRRLKVHFAGVTNPTLFRDDEKGLNEMVDIMDYFKAPAATIEVSMGRAPGSLSAQRVVDFAKRLLNRASDEKGEVSKIEVSGVLDDDSRDVFDVLQYRMVEVVNVKENRNRRSMYVNRSTEIRQAWERRRSELEAMFRT